MSLRFLLSLLLAVWSLSAAAPQSALGRPKPRLVVGIVIDQFRYDYLTRFRESYSAGFERLLRQGALFTDAQYEDFPTVTAAGHSTFMTGAIPALSGIVGNEWFDRASGKVVTSVADPATRLLGGSGQGSSPRNLLVSSLGDELKIATGGRARVVGVSLKDRAAILPSGDMADGAYWFDGTTGNFVSSTFYFPDIPQWAADFNRERHADKYAGVMWEPFKRMPSPAGEKLWSGLAASPFGNELIEAFAERAVAAERLGADEIPDLLTVSFSANDYVGHAAGPDSPEVRDISIRTDRLIGRFLTYLDSQVGLHNVLLVLTSDHGVTTIPEVEQQRHMPGGRVAAASTTAAVQKALTERFGEGKWIAGLSEFSIYLNTGLIREKKLNQAEVEETAADAVRALPHVFRAYTRSVLIRNCAMADVIGRRVVNGFYGPRSGDVIVLYDPYWLAEAHGTTHGSAFGYDTHVPVIFMGSRIKPGVYRSRIMPNDIAPTLAAVLEVEPPSGSTGRVLEEILTE